MGNFKKDVLGVVITYKETKFCEKAIKSLFNADVDVALVFNGWNKSYEPWLDKIKNKIDYIFLNKNNLGFCRGNNQAINIAIKNDYKYVLLLNNDGWVEDDCIIELKKCLEKKDDVGSVQPKVYKAWNKKLLDTTGHIFKYGQKYSWDKGLGPPLERGEMEYDEMQYDNLTNILGCCGCVVMYKVKMLKNVGLFWERLWSVCEDFELSWRAYKQGWKSVFVPEAIAYHWRGYTSLKKERRSSISDFWIHIFYRNWVLTLRRHASYKQKKFERIRLLSLGIKCKIGNFFRLSKTNSKFITLCALAINDDKYLHLIEKQIDNQFKNINY